MEKEGAGGVPSAGVEEDSLPGHCCVVLLRKTNNDQCSINLIQWKKEESVLLRWVVGFTVTTGSSSNRANKLQTQNLHLNHPRWRANKYYSNFSLLFFNFIFP